MKIAITRKVKKDKHRVSLTTIRHLSIVINIDKIRYVGCPFKKKLRYVQLKLTEFSLQ